jgi:hypothetical protein
MRRSAAALAAAVLTTLVLSGPLAASVQSAPAPTITCGAGATSTECKLLDQLAAQLAPLQPVLVLAGPAMAQVIPGAAGLAALSDQAGGVPVAQVTTQVQALLDQLDVLPAPVRNLLSAAKLDGLITTLESLLAEVTAPIAGAEAEQGAKPTPAKTGGSTAPAPAPRSTATSSGAPTLGGSLSAPESSLGASTAESPAIPDVPVGDSLTFAPLALPSFGFDTEFVAPEETAAPVAEDAPLQLEQAAADALPDGGAGTQVGVVVVLSLLLIGGAFAAQAHQNRHVIPED